MRVLIDRCIFRVQVSCAVRSYWQRTPTLFSDYIHSDTSYFVGFRVESVSIFTSLYDLLRLR